MIARLFPTLAAKIAGGVVVLLLIALAVSRIQIGSLERQIERLGQRIEVLSRDLGQCRTNVATQQAAIERQGAELQRVQTASNARVAGLTRDLDREQRARQTAQQRAAAVLARRPGADQCADALDLMRGG